MSPEFLITSLIVIASPGTGALLTIAAGLSQGPRAAVIVAFGCTLGVLPHMLAAIRGLAALLHTSALAFELIKWAGALYLIYMAWLTLQASGPLQIEAEQTVRSQGGLISHAILVNLLNPKLSLFFLAFLPQFLSRAPGQPTLLMLKLSATFMALTFLVFAAYGVLAARVREQILSRPQVLQWMRRSFAAAFLALGAKLLLVQHQTPP